MQAPYTRYKAGNQTEADRQRLHGPTADQVFVLPRGLFYEAEINTDGAACDQHRREHSVVRYTEVLHGLADLLDGGHLLCPVRQ